MNVVVTAKYDTSADKMVAMFKKKVNQTGLMDELASREYYRKPSVKKKEKLSERKRLKKRAKKLARRESLCHSH